MHVSGLDEIKARYSEPFIVETAHELEDGKPAAYKLKPLKPMALIAMGSSWPVLNEGADENGGGQVSAKNATAMLNIVARCVVAAREACKGEDGAWTERWTPLEVVCSRPPNPDAKVREISVDELDYLDTIPRLWNELLQRFQLQRGNVGDAGSNVRAEGNGEPGDAGENVRETSA